jgi:hypothetical protein
VLSLIDGVGEAVAGDGSVELPVSGAEIVGAALIGVAVDDIEAAGLGVEAGEGTGGSSEGAGPGVVLTSGVGTAGIGSGAGVLDCSAVGAAVPIP